MTVSVQQSVVLYQLCMSIPVSHIRKEEHDYTHYFVPTITLESCCHGVQSFSELGQSFQHCVLKLAATLHRLVGALILRRLQGGSLIHGCFCTKGTKGPWPSGSVPDKRLMWDSVQACAYEYFQCLHGGGWLELEKRPKCQEQLEVFITIYMLYYRY